MASITITESMRSILYNFACPYELTHDLGQGYCLYGTLRGVGTCEQCPFAHYRATGQNEPGLLTRLWNLLCTGSTLRSIPTQICIAHLTGRCTFQTSRVEPGQLRCSSGFHPSRELLMKPDELQQLIANALWHQGL